MIESPDTEHQIRRGRPPKPIGAPPHRKPSEQIGYIEGLNLIRAVTHAAVIDKPLNTRVDIQWRLAPTTHMDAFTRRTRLLNAMGNWIRRTAKAGEPVYVYVREIGLGGHEHLHLAAHVPETRYTAFKAMIRKTVEADAEPGLEPVQYPNDRDAVKVQKIRPGAWNIAFGVTSYFLKEGCEELLALALTIGEKHVVDAKHAAKATGGVIYGRRVGVSRAIGHKARQTHRLGGPVPTSTREPKNGAHAVSPAGRAQGAEGW